MKPQYFCGFEVDFDFAAELYKDSGAAVCWSSLKKEAEKKISVIWKRRRKSFCGSKLQDDDQKPFETLRFIANGAQIAHMEKRPWTGSSEGIWIAGHYGIAKAEIAYVLNHCRIQTEREAKSPTTSEFQKLVTSMGDFITAGAQKEVPAAIAARRAAGLPVPTAAAIGKAIFSEKKPPPAFLVSLVPVFMGERSIDVCAPSRKQMRRHNRIPSANGPPRP